MIVRNAKSTLTSRPILSARNRASVLARTASAPLRRGGGGAGEDGMQMVVADEVDAVEIHLRLELGRQLGACGNATERNRAQEADHERTGDRRSHRGRQILCGTAQRPDIAREPLGARR
jgi:hypothetical protein